MPRLFHRSLAASLIVCASFASTSLARQQDAEVTRRSPTKDTKPDKRGLLGLPSGVAAAQNLEYAVVDGKPLLLDIYTPEKPADDVKLPVIIWIHGGGWESGTKDGCPAALLVPHGYAAVSIGYRFSQVAPYPAQIHDCKAAVRWVRAHANEYNIDPDRIGVWGASAGGHLVSLLGTTSGDKKLEGNVGDHLDQSSKVQAVCNWFGPTDIVKLCRMAGGETAAEAGEPREDLTLKAESTTPTDASVTPESDKKPRKVPTPSPIRKLLGGSIQNKLALAATANPITYIDKDDAPILIVHGDADTLVPIDQSNIFLAALEKAGVPVKLHVVKNGGHGFWNDELLKLVRDFFDEKLKKPLLPRAE